MQDVAAKIGMFGFFDTDLKLPEMTLGRNHDTLSWHKQSLCEVRTVNIFQKKYRADTDIALCLSMTLNYVTIWHWVKIMIHPHIISDLCVIWKLLSMVFRKEVKNRTRKTLSLPMTLNLPKWCLLIIMRHIEVVNNLCVK